MPDPNYRWTIRKAAAFIGALVHFGRVAEAGRAVGMGRQSVYRLRERLGADGLFAVAWDRALAEGQAQRQAKRRTGRKATVLPQERDIFGIGK